LCVRVWCTAPDYSFIILPKKDTQEEFEDTKGVIRSRTPTKDTQEELEDTKGVISGRTPKKDRQEEFRDKQGVIRGVHQTRTHKKSLEILKE
jgi:hypothetical protein